MGLEKFTNFISKSINNNGFEELYINNNTRKIVANHIIFDINFLIYQELLEIENEINNIIKIILCLSLSVDNKDIIKQLLKKKFSEKHFIIYTKSDNLINMIDNNIDEDIIKQFNLDFNEKYNTISLIELIIYNKIKNLIINNIDNYHVIEIVNNISLFFDGIPSISKVIEQRRRRIKNYLESITKKNLYKTLFDSLSNTNIELTETIENNIKLYYNFSKWNKNKFIIDKSLGPASVFIINCEQYIYKEIKLVYPKIKIYINSSTENGESDFKIFKYIYSHNNIGDYCIHTIDSDFIYLMMIQQIYYKIINRDVNISILKYIKQNNNTQYIQILDGNLIIKNILNLYNSVNNIKSNNYKIIWDICIIFFFFGNDHLPVSIEIGIELGLEYYLKMHYQALNTNNIVQLDNNNLSINFKNLLLFLKKINETRIQNITKIILQRFFKINIILINILVNTLNLNFKEILEFLKEYIINKRYELSNEDFENLDEDDLRKIYAEEINNKTIKCWNLLNENICKLIDENIDYSEKEYNGLILYIKPYIIYSNKYQNIQNYISEKAIYILNKQYPLFYNYNDINEHLNQLNNIIYTNADVNVNATENTNTEDYLKKIFHLIITQFGPMDNIHTDNITFYKYYYVPSLESIITYLTEINNLDINNKWTNDIILDNIDKNNYLNSINHHLLISPFSNNITLQENINLNKIDNLWIENIEDFNYRNIDIKKFFNCW